MLQFGKGLNSVETGLRALPRPAHLPRPGSSQDPGPECLVQRVSSEETEVTEHKGSAPAPLGAASPFPRPRCGKGLR